MWDPLTAERDKAVGAEPQGDVSFATRYDKLKIMDENMIYLRFIAIYLRPLYK